jgi:putative transcription factor
VITSRRTTLARTPPPLSPESELEVRRDYAKVLREAREKMGLTQEELGKKINEKASVISHLEGGKLKPDIALARKLEHFFKIKLLVTPEEEEV